ncbi:MAG: AAA family ATPase, partial [Actinomycetota bacterium]
MSLQSVADVRSALDEQNYLASDGLATAVFLAVALNRPLLLEGEAGVGKTELAKVLAKIRQSELIRLQCYEGIDASQAMYDWDYSRQLLHLRTVEATGEATVLGADKLEGQL